MTENRLKVKTNSITEDYNVSWAEKLGCGVSGPVRPCINIRTGEQFALKCLLDRPRSQLEISLHLKCSGHPNIVQIYDVYANEVQFPGEKKPMPRLLVVMELMKGGELFDRISKQQGFTERRAAQFMKQIAQAVHRCHSLNIAHRDIKPENLLLRDHTENCEVKLSDFGFAKVDDGHLKTPHFTPYYVAPQVLEAQREQARAAFNPLYRNLSSRNAAHCTYDKSCDMWSLGVILYIMLCGYPPFYSETPSKQLSSHMKKRIMAGRYEFPSNDWDHISEDAKYLVKNMLRVDPSERLTVEELLAHHWMSEAPETKLVSPAIMSDSEALEEVKDAHSQHLTNLRMPEQQVILKPVPSANNKILQKRKAKAAAKTAKHTSIDRTLQSLKDIVMHCERAHSDDGDIVLDKLTYGATRYCSDIPSFVETLKQWKWDGEKFNATVDKAMMLSLLQPLVTQLETKNQQQQP